MQHKSDSTGVITSRIDCVYQESCTSNGRQPEGENRECTSEITNALFQNVILIRARVRTSATPPMKAAVERETPRTYVDAGGLQIHKNGGAPLNYQRVRLLYHAHQPV